MVDKNPVPSPDTPQPVELLAPDPTQSGGPPRRSPMHRGADARDTVAELAERAQIISQEAGSKVAAAMKDVISAAAGIAGFSIESARDLVQYMIKRGQMTPTEGEKLIREAEAAHDKRPDSEKTRPTATKVAAERAAIAKAEAAVRAAAQPAVSPFRPFQRAAPPTAPVVPPNVGSKPPANAKAVKIERPAKVEKPAAKSAEKIAAKTNVKPATKAVAKPASKPVAKTASKNAKVAKPAKKSGKR